MNLSLTNKTALVCGASQGIGLATAQELAKLGATCILLARNEESLQKAVEELPANYNQKHKFFVADFSNTDNVKIIASQIVSEHPIHILINNTGGPAGGPIIDAKEEDFINTFNQHLICNHILTPVCCHIYERSGLWQNHKHHFNLCKNSIEKFKAFQIQFVGQLHRGLKRWRMN